MKKYILLSLCLMTLSSSFAQLKDFKFKFYGQIRTDFYYNSRANEETVDGLFYMYPKDELLDSNGEDLNDTSNSNFYTLYSRLGLDVAGPKLGTAKTSAKVEVDFRGSGTSYSTIRLRHAYFNLDWGKPAVLVGQTCTVPAVQPCTADSLSLQQQTPSVDRSIGMAVSVSVTRTCR